MKIFSSIMAAMGRQLKQSVNVFHNLILYRRLPKRQEKTGVMRQQKKKGKRITQHPSMGHIKRKEGRTFVIKAIYPVDTGAFVITSEDEKVFWIFDFVGEE